MKVVIDGSSCYDTYNGGYKYFVHIIPRLAQLPDTHVEVIPSPVGIFDSIFPNSVTVRPRWKAPAGIGWLPAGRVRRFLSRGKRAAEALVWRRRQRPPESGGAPSPTLFHSYYYTQPIGENLPQVQTVLDMIPELMGAEVGLTGVDAFVARKREAIGRAAHLIAISEKTKADACAFYGIAPERIDVVHLGVNYEYFAEPTTDADRRALLAAHGIDRPFFLQVGGRSHHKNFLRLLEAYVRSGLRRDLLLVSTGEVWQEDEKRRIAELGIEADLRLIRWPDEAQLRLLYQSATALAYPSLYEGFGLPPVEAMGAGLPVAAGQGSGSVPEICGDAVEYFDPRDIDSIADTLRRVTDSTRAAELRAKGYARCEQFHWDRCARLTRAAYDRVLLR